MSFVLSFVKSIAWRCSKGQIIHFRYRKAKKDRYGITNVLSSLQTIDYIIQNHCSVARFGDGEFQMIEHGLSGGDPASFPVDTFQPFDKKLAARLNDVLLNPKNNLLVCIPYPMLHSEVYSKNEKVFFEREWLFRRDLMNEVFHRHSILGDSTFTRFYLHRKDIQDFDGYIKKLKGIWENRQIILVEGEKSRLGVGNDLFDNATGVSRILCPATNAFHIYDQLLSFIEHLGKDLLFLLALGHTATVLASDLAERGYQAIDIGHIDIEYEWYRMKAGKKIPVPGKYVNEVAKGRIVNDSLSDQTYENQIIAKIGTE
jgi:glycosyltransferase family protein